MVLLSLLLALSCHSLQPAALAQLHNRSQPTVPNPIFQPYRTNPLPINFQPIRPNVYLTAVPNFGADTISISNLGAYLLPFRPLTQDLLYAYEGTWNQLVAARGRIQTAVRDGIYEQTSTFRASHSPSSGEAFTLAQLQSIITILFRFAEIFGSSTRDLRFVYRRKGRGSHVAGYLRLHSSSPSLPTRNFTSPLSSLIPHSSPVSLSLPSSSTSATDQADPPDPFTLPSQDPLRQHPAALTTFSSYGAPIPFPALAAALMALYAWSFELIIQHHTDDISINLPPYEPLLIHPEIEIDIRADPTRVDGLGQGGWLPLWVIKNVLMSLLKFGLDWEPRETRIEYREVEGGKGCWGYVTRRGARGLPPGR
ncbi:MAG: hypothetical protein Q9195_006981 [Heterodermia aff. obscurata]